MTVKLSISLEELEKEITCALCQEYYIDPKILPCLHYYCKQCIFKLALKTGENKSFSCPECRKYTTLPKGGEEELRSAFFINRLKSMYSKYKKAINKQALCEMCTDSVTKAEAFCQQCDKFACKNCVHMHSAMKVLFDGHIITSIDELHKANSEELIPKGPPFRKCQAHGESLKIFCFDCNKLICGDCTVKDHKLHNIEFVKIASDIKKKELLESLKPLREVEDSLSQALKEVSDTEREVEAQGYSLAHTIETSFKKLYKILETRKQEILEESRNKIEKKLEHLKGQEKNFSIASLEICSIIDYTEQCVRRCSDEEVMSMHAEISRQIQEINKRNHELRSRKKPIEKANLVVKENCEEALKELCQTNINIGVMGGPHSGIFHCCTWCSSGSSSGRRTDTKCGCGSVMSGGYIGCGHGHAGHPGCYHWSCCGNIVKKSECL